MNSTNQKKSARAQHQIDEMPDSSLGYAAGSGQNSGKNLKITFVGDQALLK